MTIEEMKIKADTSSSRKSWCRDTSNRLIVCTCYDYYMGDNEYEWTVEGSLVTESEARSFVEI